MSNVLTNNTGTSIILSFNNVLSPEANVISMAPGESILYNTVAVTNELDPNYNIPLIQEYLDANILINETVSNTAKSELQLLSQGNLVLNFSTNVPQLASKYITDNIDNDCVLPVNNPDNLQYIYYKSKQGMSVSSDFGNSQVLIDNTNLLYPDEITSFAVQVNDSINGILIPVNRLYIGTLREGVKTFTPGVDTTYVDLDPGAAFDTSSPVFKNVLTQITNTYTDPNVTPVVTTAVSFTSYCPTYVLAIINNINAGCPIFIASRTIQTTSTTTIHILVDGSVTSSTVSSQVYQTKVVFKYLHSSIYVNNVNIPVIPTQNIPSYSTLSNSWILLQENNVQSIGISSIISVTPTFPAHILDVFTEYISGGALFVIKDNTGTNYLYNLSCYQNLSAVPTIVQIPLISNLQTGKINNLSYLLEISSLAYDIFITTDTQVWRYSSSSNTWSLFIYPGNTISYLSTSVTNGILDPAGITNLKELTNFIIVPQNNTPSSYLGILSSELGLILYNLKLISNIFTANAKVAQVLLANVSRTAISDMKSIINGQDIYIFTCSYSSQIPRTYYNNTNCFQLINNQDPLVSNVYYLKSDIESSKYPYYVAKNIALVNNVPSAEQLAYDPILINSDYSYNLVSPKYSFKLNGLAADSVLVSALTSTLAYKYYNSYIIERIVSSVSNAELNILQLSEYIHRIRMPYLQATAITATLGAPYPVVNSNSIVIPNTSVYNASLNSGNSFVCIEDYTNKTVIPSAIATTQPAPGQYSTEITFTIAFTGTVYVQAVSSPAVSYPVNGLFALIQHGLNKYPQVILNNSSDLAALNDIKYVDNSKIEISYKSSMNTTISLI